MTRYLPGGAPAVSRAQARRIDAHADWERRRDQVASQMIDLLTAGRLDEAREFQSVIDDVRATEPAW